MKSAKIFFITSVILLTVAVMVGVYVWYTVQKYDIQVNSGAPGSLEKSDIDESVMSTSQEEPIVIKKSDLSSTQQKTLETLGYERDTLTVTPGMITCAKDAVGVERYGQILSGSAPSPLESLKLLPCFNK
jgi:hypothetical protein